RQGMGRVGQAVGGDGEEAIPPVLGGVPGDPQARADGGIARPIGGLQDDLRPQRRLLAARARADAPLQLGAFGANKLDGRSMASHGVLSGEEEPPTRQAYTRHLFRSNLKRMDY